MPNNNSVARAKILPLRDLVLQLRQLRRHRRRIVFTNGCFDVLHLGHVRYLQAARALGDVLVVAVNSDASVRRLKGADRPLNPARARCEVLAALEAVDFVTIFSADTPLAAIREVAPDVLVKGGDWPPDAIVGADLVRARGGEVRALPFVRGYSTTDLLARAGQRGRKR